MRTAISRHRGGHLRVDWHIGADLFDLEVGGERIQRLTPYGLHEALREVGAERQIKGLMRQLGRRYTEFNI